MPRSHALIFDWCAWCLRREGRLTKDHVFVRCAGGTREVYVPACDPCQQELRKHEEHLARSVFGVFRLAKGPPPRHRGDPRSGAIDAQSVLVPEPLGGYGERAFRVGVDAPIVLPSIQLDMERRQAHVRGLDVAEIERLAEAVATLISQRPDGTMVVDTRLVPRGPVHPSYTDDPKFFPRVFFDEYGRLCVRGRTKEECTRTIGFIAMAAHAGAFRNHSGWTTGIVRAGTNYEVVLIYEPIRLHRIIAKVAYGVAASCAGPDLMARDPWPGLRRFIIEGVEPSGGHPVVELHPLGTIKDWPDDHIAVILGGTQVSGVVSISGGLHVVNFGDGPVPPGLSLPRVATSKRVGTSTRVLPEGSGEDLLEALRRHIDLGAFPGLPLDGP